MPNMSTIDPSQLFTMFKGEPGTRKSTAALSFPGPQYWFSFDQKMNALNIPMRNWGVDPESIDFDNYASWEKARLKLTQFQTKPVNAKGEKYKTIIIDSITSCADHMLRDVLKIKAGGSTGKRVGGIAVSSVEDFNAESSGLSEMVALCKDIHTYHKINIVLIAHVIQTEQKTLEGRTHMSRIIVTAAKKIAAKLPGYCDEVYHFNMKGGKYALLTEHTGDDFARTTLPLDTEIVFGDEPLYDKWLRPAIAKMQEAPKVVNRIA